MTLQRCAVIVAVMVSVCADAPRELVAQTAFDARCRARVGRYTQILTRQLLSAHAGCHRLRRLGRIDANIDCNDLSDPGFPERYALRLAFLEARIERAMSRACWRASAPADNGWSFCPAPCEAGIIEDYDDVGRCVVCVAEAEVAALLREMYGQPEVGEGYDAAAQCQERALMATGRSYVLRRMAEQWRCQWQEDHGLRAGVDCRGEDDRGRIAAARERLWDRIGQCSDADLAALQSCAPTVGDEQICLPALLDDFTDDLFAAVYADSAPLPSATPTPTFDPATATATFALPTTTPESVPPTATAEPDTPTATPEPATPTWTVVPDTPTATAPPDPPTATPTARLPFAGLHLESVLQDSTSLDFVVKSKIYPEDPSSMYLTLRGGGVSVYDVSDAAAPVLRTRWASGEDVEGQDRLGDLLVVVGREGKLFTFDVSDPQEIVPRGEVTLEPDPDLVESITAELFELVGNGPFAALHVKLDVGEDGRTYAFVTATASGELISMDVTDPDNPVQVGAVDADVQFIEGIYIHEGHAFLGGFGTSDVYRAVDIADPSNMTVVRSLSDNAYRQMVSEMHDAYPDVLFAALWNDEGGLGTFNVSDPASFFELDRYVRPELERSNRVKINGDIALLPLEQEPGGMALIDISDPANLAFLGLARGIRGVDTPYTLQPNGDYVYLFGTATQSMAVLRIDRDEPAETYGVWSFGPSSAVADLAGAGIAADQGQGRMFFLDPEDTGSGGTAAQTSVGEIDGIGYLAIDPAGSWATDNGFWVEHGMDRTVYGTLSQYTLIWDVYVPDFAGNGCYSGALALCDDIPLYQLDRTNQNDAELFLKVGATFLSDNGFIGKAGDPINGGGLGGYAEALEPDTWYRIAMVVDLRDSNATARVYVNGAQVLHESGIDYELFASVGEGDPDANGLPTPGGNGFLLFADNNDEMDTEVYLSSFLFADRAYSAQEIGTLGAPGAAGIPAP